MNASSLHNSDFIFFGFYSFWQFGGWEFGLLFVKSINDAIIVMEWGGGWSSPAVTGKVKEHTAVFFFNIRGSRIWCIAPSCPHFLAFFFFHIGCVLGGGGVGLGGGYIRKTVQTQGSAHTRRPVAAARVFFFLTEVRAVHSALSEENRGKGRLGGAQ